MFWLAQGVISTLLQKWITFLFCKITIAWVHCVKSHPVPLGNVYYFDLLAHSNSVLRSYQYSMIVVKHPVFIQQWWGIMFPHYCKWVMLNGLEFTLHLEIF